MNRLVLALSVFSMACIEVPTGSMGGTPVGGTPAVDVDVDRPDGGMGEMDYYYDGPLTDADRIVGDMGFVNDFDERIYRRSIQSNDWGTYIEAHVLGDAGWAMLIVDVNKVFGSDEFSPGSLLRMDSIGNGDDGVSGGTTGCSGPGEWDFSFDQQADSTEISVSENPTTGDWEITIVADFGPDGVSTGTVVVPPPQG